MMHEHTSRHLPRQSGALLFSLILSLLLVAVVPRQAIAGDVRAALAVQADKVAEHIAAGDRESAARKSAAALAHFEAALAIDPNSHAALWRAARDAVDLGEVEAEAKRRAEIYAKAVDYARRAVAIDERNAEGHFHLSRALGRTALSVGARDRVRYAEDIRAEAARAIELDPRHPGALHVLGVWHAEVMRLNGVTRMLAKSMLGAKTFSTASWSEATRLLEQAVAIEPDRLVHHLDLARIYRDTKRKSEARASYEAALRCPVIDANDATYRRAAESELKALK